MIVLGIETATTVCGAALVGDGVLLAEASIDERNVHAERLLGQIDDVLTRAGVQVRSLGGIAVSIGPGSFTGLRIGLSVAKGLVVAAAIPIAGVPTLDALARHAAGVDPLGDEEGLLAVLDARRDNVYCQAFGPGTRGLTALGEACLMSVAAVRSEYAGRKLLVTGDAAGKVIGTAAATVTRWRRATAEASRCSAFGVALAGERLLRNGHRDDPSTLEPHYLQEFVVKSR